MIVFSIYLIGVIVSILFFFNEIRKNEDITLINLIIVLTLGFSSWVSLLIATIILYGNIIIFKKKRND